MCMQNLYVITARLFYLLTLDLLEWVCKDWSSTVAVSGVCYHQDAMAGVWNRLFLSGISKALYLWHSYAENSTDGCLSFPVAYNRASCLSPCETATEMLMSCQPMNH